VFLLILDSLGSTELLFILVMALIFFGPRKLPQISRTLGKNLAEFRKASEDFKRTWEREVALETPQSDVALEPPALNADNNIMDPATGHESPDHTLEAVPVHASVSRETTPTAADAGVATGNPAQADEALPSQPLRKRDWL
jgi:TatA/E family protein of Tat protein translocase